MKPVDTYKALSYELLVYGYQPLDLVIILCLFFLLLVFSRSILLDIFAPMSCLYLAKKFRDRPQGFFTSLGRFCFTPPMATLERTGDVRAYGNAIDEVERKKEPDDERVEK